jgi:predicted GNAT family acetyltransferase
MPFRYDYPVRVATRDDIPLLLELYKDFEFGPRDLREVEFEVQKAVDRSACFFIELEGRAVSAGMIVSETDRAGVISYSRTLPEFRGRGLYFSVRTACCEYLFKQGKVVLGVVKESNTAMIRIISKCGSMIGKRSIVYFARKPPLRRRVRRLGSRFKNKILRQWLRKGEISE